MKSSLKYNSNKDPVFDINDFRWNYDLSNPIKTTEDPNYDPTADYTMNLHPDIATVGKQ